MGMFLYSWFCEFFCISVLNGPLHFCYCHWQQGSEAAREQGRIWGASGTDLYSIFHDTSVSLLAFQGLVMIVLITHC